MCNKQRYGDPPRFAHIPAKFENRLGAGQMVNRDVTRKTCRICGAVFVAYDGKRGRPKTYCSQACRWRAKRTPESTEARPHDGT